MFIPLHDRNALRHIRRQYVTFGLIVANIITFALTVFLTPESVAEANVLGLGFIPAVAFDNAVLDPSLVIVPPDATYLTYSFLHVDAFHLGSNMLFLWVFGDNVEDALGHLRFLVFYLACAAAGALFHGFVTPLSQAPLIGASGAVSGVVSAYLMLHPKVRVWVLVLFRFPLPLPAFVPLLFWIGQQFVMLATDGESTVSWGAHVGGILAGALLVLVMRRRGVPLFDRTIVTPVAVHHHLEPAPRAVLPAAAETKGPIHWGR
ncbi:MULTISPECIES: rhomboid family intramembrane serine protease [Alphaproteobacteria]|uniref:Rhomboid family intramembrane serine protease n=2 Tax=Alphaproteobacteria TaxID=28211 RepID=A0A512HLQ3_9HYPH|nr:MULTISPECIES: rhomboid family intramembrane serine protease [Alphaproteobacteria]GEO86330.1 rhomboid family intramembrane serine protease [Ciceribacter naphthalenivorans]GLR21812.1 rhomboid family intramembrane serine protease [Ciceribacter naphthalenivorans]GLT04668.1 rhomboid family intramembrane serine protease [Sphingomonas psychrolutea]